VDFFIKSGSPVRVFANFSGLLSRASLWCVDSTFGSRRLKSLSAEVACPGAILKRTKFKRRDGDEPLLLVTAMTPRLIVYTPAWPVSYQSVDDVLMKKRTFWVRSVTTVKG
jgi:hypothetical protein